MARLAIRTLLLVCAALPAAGTTKLGIPVDTIEVVDFYARATVVLPSGETQPNTEVRAGLIRPGTITLHLRMKRNGGPAQSVEWRMYRTPETPKAFDTGIRAAAIPPDGTATVFAATQAQVGAFEIRAVADPQNRFSETPRARTNNQRSIVLLVVPPEPPGPYG